MIDVIIMRIHFQPLFFSRIDFFMFFTRLKVIPLHEGSHGKFMHPYKLKYTCLCTSVHKEGNIDECMLVHRIIVDCFAVLDCFATGCFPFVSCGMHFCLFLFLPFAISSCNIYMHMLKTFFFFYKGEAKGSKSEAKIMTKISSISTTKIPEGVTLQAKFRKVSVTGPRGTLTKDFSHLQLEFRINKSASTFTVIRWFGTKIPIATINTAISHVKNMIIGVTKGYRYKVRCAYAHFPINVSVEGQQVEIRNFLGEKRVRRLNVPNSVKVTQTDPSKVKDEVVFDGNDLEEVSHQAALMHQQCLVRKKDIRKFLDGIYVQTKTHVEA